MTSRIKDTTNEVLKLLDGLPLWAAETILADVKKQVGMRAVINIHDSSSFVPISSVPHWEDRLVKFDQPLSQEQRH